MLIMCKKCNIQHDSRDVNNGICVWCEQKEDTEIMMLQYEQYFSFLVKGHKKQDKR